VRTVYSEEARARLSRLRLFEICVAVVLTLAALLFVAMTVWAAEPGKIAVSEGWARPTIGEGRATAAYFSVTNTGEMDDTLVAARTANAKSVELHQTVMTSDGVMQMRPVKGGLPIPVGATLKLSPGGAHVMIMGLDQALAAGDELAMTLEFAKAGPVEIVLPVQATAPDGTGADGGHAHH
jgi:periplasmic copper chaperone A